MPRGIEEGVATRCLYFIVDEARFVVGMLHLDDVHGRFPWNGEAIVGIGSVVAARVIATFHGIDNGAVAKHQCCLGIADGMVSHLVEHVPPEGNLTFLCRHSKGSTDQYGQ